VRNGAFVEDTSCCFCCCLRRSPVLPDWLSWPSGAGIAAQAVITGSNDVALLACRQVKGRAERWHGPARARELIVCPAPTRRQVRCARDSRSRPVLEQCSHCNRTSRLVTRTKESTRHASVRAWKPIRELKGKVLIGSAEVPRRPPLGQACSIVWLVPSGGPVYEGVCLLGPERVRSIVEQAEVGGNADGGPKRF